MGSKHDKDLLVSDWIYFQALRIIYFVTGVEDTGFELDSWNLCSIIQGAFIKIAQPV
jgi:hypothetical protein